MQYSPRALLTGIPGIMTKLTTPYGLPNWDYLTDSNSWYMIDAKVDPDRAWISNGTDKKMLYKHDGKEFTTFKEPLTLQEVVKAEVRKLQEA